MERQRVTEEDLFESKPDVVSGALVFKGTRIPVEAFFDNLAAGLSLDDVTEELPGIGRERAEAAIIARVARNFRPSRRVIDALLDEVVPVDLVAVLS